MYDHVFDNHDFTKSPLSPGEYESCTFINADLSNADISGIVFIECQFRDSNLSNAKLGRTSFREVEFRGCKMLGLHFDDCTPFLQAPVFENCDLKFSSFTGLKLPGIAFKNCILQEADFTGTEMPNAVFERSDLSGAVFDNTNLEQSDFRTSFNYIIDPENNKVKKARFSLEGLPGLLNRYRLQID